MYSYAQCTVQERLVCGGDVPCLAHMEQGSGPLHPEQLPPSLSAWGNRNSVYWQLSRRMDLDSGVEICSQPNLCFWIMYVILSLFHLESCFWRVYQMIVCLVLIAVTFLGWLTTTRNKQVSSCAFITLSWAVSWTGTNWWLQLTYPPPPHPPTHPCVKLIKSGRISACLSTDCQRFFFLFFLDLGWPARGLGELDTEPSLAELVPVHRSISQSISNLLHNFSLWMEVVTAIFAEDICQRYRSWTNVRHNLDSFVGIHF